MKIRLVVVLLPFVLVLFACDKAKTGIGPTASRHFGTRLCYEEVLESAQSVAEEEGRLTILGYTSDGSVFALAGCGGKEYVAESRLANFAGHEPIFCI